MPTSRVPMARPLKNATLRQLVTFHTLARLGSVSRTAEELSLTQPAVSLQLGILEESAGTPLLQRGARGVRLTDAGKLLASYADRMITLWQEAGEAMAAHRGHVAGTLRVGAVTTAEYLVPQLLLDFAGEHEQIGVKLSVGNRADIIQQLARQDIDLAIMGRPPAELRVSAAPFARHPMSFVAAPGHGVLARTPVALEDLAEVTLLVRERGSGTRTAVEQLFKAAGIEMKLGAELSSNEAIKQMCAAGFGIAFISLHACVLELQSGVLVPLPIAGHPIEREWYVITLEDRPLPAAAKAFSDFLKAQGQARVDHRLKGQAVPSANKTPTRSGSAASGGQADRKRANKDTPT